MFVRFAFLAFWIGAPPIAAAQDYYQPAGSRVIASPLYLPDRWEECTVIEPIPEAVAYSLSCRTGEFIVGRDHVLPWSDEAAARVAPPGAAPDTPKVGELVLASPLSLENAWEICLVRTDLTFIGAYEFDCPSGRFVVATTWVRKADGTAPVAAAPAPAAAPAAEPAPAPAPAEAAVPAPLPAAEPALREVAGQAAIPDGIYLAPVGGGLEVLQILGGLVALNPRVFLTPDAFRPDNAALVGTLAVAGGQIRIDWQGAEPREGSFTFDGTCLGWGYIYCRATPFEPGTTLEGRYVGAATAGGGVVSRTSELIVTPDGRYAFAAVGAIGAPAGTSGAAAAQSADQGRYEVDGWTLRLYSDDGSVREVLAFPYEIYGRHDPIYVDGGMMRRQ